MLRKYLTLSTIMLTAIFANAQYPYKVIAPMPGIEEGAVAYLYNYDTSEKIDSARVYEGAAVFTGEIDEPYLGRIIADGNRMGHLIVEQGTMAINPEKKFAVGTMLNDRLKECVDSLNAIALRVNESQTDEERETYWNQYVTYETKMIEENIDSPISLMLFMDYTEMVSTEEMMSFLDNNPSLKEYSRVQRLLREVEKKYATSAGKPMVDFEVTYNGETKRLSDYVGKGKYVLVDFWASWCGPCIREIGTLKEIYEKYKDKNLEVLGVAVWDEPKNTEAAIKRLQIPWEVIINAQTIPTDAYGISGIPCIIMFDPEGTIVFRGLQDAELKQAVDAIPF